MDVVSFLRRTDKMMVGARLQSLRESKNLSQGDIEKKTGLLRCYVSRVENGHTVPALETLEKWARALNMELYQILYDGDKPPKERNSGDDNAWGSHGKDARYLHKICGCLSRMSAGNRNLLMGLAENMAKRKKSRS
jgi:transcriptional regulator with XRE-family HTH domain